MAILYVYIYIHISIEIAAEGFGAFGASRSSAALERTFSRSDAPVCTHFKKKTLRLARLFRVLPLNLAARARFWLVRTLPGVVFESPGSILGAKMVVFSKLLRAHARARRTCCYLAETPLKLMFRAHQSCCATRRGSCKIVKIRSASLSASLFAKVGLQNRSETSSRGS